MVMNHADLVGTEITTGSGITLAIVGHNGGVGNNSRHLFHCKECAKDPEMFGDGRFLARYHDVKKGWLPCGCASKPRWSEWQYRVRAKRVSIARGYRFYGWHGEFSGYKTEMQLFCPEHGRLKTKLVSFLRTGQGCRRCYEISVRERAPSDEAVAEKYLDKCGYPRGTKVRRLDADGEFGKRSKFEVFCPVCASDEYATAGLCDGVFETDIEALCGGYRACRCANTHRLPESLATYKVKSILSENNSIFLSWVDGYINTRSRLSAYCKEHGEFSISMACLSAGQGCRHCGYERNAKKAALGDRELGLLLSLAKYPNGSKIKRISSGRLEVECSKCKEDEISQAGLCDGSFTTTDTVIRRGLKSCRCGAHHRRPEPVAKHMASGILQESGHDFLGWAGEYTGVDTHVYAKCPDHGEYKIRLSRVFSGGGCPKCSSFGYSTERTGYCYLLVSEEKDKMKIGITNVPDSRMSQLKYNTPFPFYVHSIKEMQGSDAPVMEQRLLGEYERLHLKGFDGSTEWCRFDSSIFKHFEPKPR